jgi:hypothetical protein
METTTPTSAGNATPNEQSRLCKYCQNEPCLLEDGLYDIIVEYADELRENDATLNNKEIRFQLYRRATNWIHGYLGRQNRVELPKCVRGEIVDIAPDPNQSYVGFQAADSQED